MKSIRLHLLWTTTFLCQFARLCKLFRDAKSEAMSPSFFWLSFYFWLFRYHFVKIFALCSNDIWISILMLPQFVFFFAAFANGYSFYHCPSSHILWHFWYFIRFLQPYSVIQCLTVLGTFIRKNRLKLNLTDYGFWPERETLVRGGIMVQTRRSLAIENNTVFIVIYFTLIWEDANRMATMREAKKQKLLEQATEERADVLNKIQLR